MRKVYAAVTIKLVMHVEEGVDVADIVDEMDYDFHIPEKMGYLGDTEIIDWEVQDSK